jgi:hypothetical protein
MTDTDGYPQRKEMFDVVMLKDGVNDLIAKTADFKRVPIEAEAPFAAMTHPDVQAAAKGFRVLFAVPPGVATEPEIHARRREMEGETVDRSKI